MDAEQKHIADSGQFLTQLASRISYLADVIGDSRWYALDTLLEEVTFLRSAIFELPAKELFRRIKVLDERISILEDRAAKEITPVRMVNIVRSVQRFTLQDILENIYDSFTELGGEEDCNIDPAVVVARATISRRVKKKIYRHQVMVIGHEKGMGEEYRNGGCAKPWGNDKALRYMKVAETEGIPIHFFIFTPGSYPIEDFPGAAQQIARNIYAMSKLEVPMVSFISEGGSGGAEAIGLADMRLMASHGYYSVISPEGAAAIEGRIREGQKVPRELIEKCAEQLCMTAEDNLRLGTIDRIVQEPPLGARRDDYDFFKRLRFEMIKATDEVVLSTKSFRAFRAYALRRQVKKHPQDSTDDFGVHISWNLSDAEIERLLELRSQKYRAMGQGYIELKKQTIIDTSTLKDKTKETISRLYYEIKYGLLKPQKKNVQKVLQEVTGEGAAFLSNITEPVKAAVDFLAGPQEGARQYSDEAAQISIFNREWEQYVSPLANEDRTVSCPNAAKYGCLDLWVPDLYGEFCGVCPTCGHHFPLEYQWYLQNLFDAGSVREFNNHIISGNPLKFQGLDARLNRDVQRTGRKSGIITFKAKLNGIKIVVAMPYSNFRSGTFGSAEGEKFIRACDLARTRRRPFIAYIHTTGGIRIQEGTLGVIQMPRCTMAVREYVDSGGLYIVVYDNNSYAGPVASFLGCSPYQVGIRSSRIGFAGPRVIRETTGQDVPPDYHSARNALMRGHIQGIWDRRDFRKNLYDALQTMGGPNLYYK